MGAVRLSAWRPTDSWIWENVKKRRKSKIMKGSLTLKVILVRGCIDKESPVQKGTWPLAEREKCEMKKEAFNRKWLGTRSENPYYLMLRKLQI